MKQIRTNLYCSGRDRLYPESSTNEEFDDELYGQVYLMNSQVY